MRFFRLLIVGCVVCVLSSCTTVSRVDLQAEAAVIRELDRQWLAAFTAKDIDALMTYFAEDAILMPAGAPAIVGQGPIREWYGLWLPDPAVSTSFAPDVVEVAQSGDLAYDRGTFHFAKETPEGRIEATGKYLIIWKKLRGKWKATIDISNGDSP